MEISQEVASNVPVIPKDVEDEEIESEEETVVESSNPKKRKKIKKRSPYWDFYDEVKVKEGDPSVKILKGKCKECKTLIKADSEKNGTSALKKHYIVCCRRKAEQKNQGVLNLQASASTGGTGALTNWKFDQKEIRMLLCELVVLLELPFRFVDHKALKRLFAQACPQFVVTGRKAIKADCVRLYRDGKEEPKSIFSKEGMGKVSITTDCWTSINTSFICVTAHFIGGDWNLHKKIVNFQKISGHKGDDIAHSIIESLNEWELKTLVCCTMDNASANDKAVDYLRGFLNTRKMTILDGKYLHMRCVAHIINLVVSSGLEEMGMSVRRVREVLKWIKGSIDSKRFLCLDVATRWNSTYLMLEAAEPYAEAIKMCVSMSNPSAVAELSQKTHNGLTVGPPGEDDWNNVRKMIKYLKKFYDMTCLVSGHTYATSHLFLLELCNLINVVSELEASTDIEVSLMATKMREKVGQYWLEEEVLNPKMNKLLYIVYVLDPRQKIKMVEKCFKKLYEDFRANELVKHVKELVFEMFVHYMAISMTTPSTSSTTSRSSIERSSLPRDSYSELLDNSDDEDDASDSSELHMYLAEKYKKEGPFEFDILVWWSKHDLRYPILSRMAKDFLVIPISTVPSESAFSTGGFVLDKFRSYSVILH